MEQLKRWITWPGADDNPIEYPNYVDSPYLGEPTTNNVTTDATTQQPPQVLTKPIHPPTKIQVAQTTDGKGLGVFATQQIDKGELIEIAPLINLPVQTNSMVLMDYRFWYPKLTPTDETGYPTITSIYVIALGYASMYNHSQHSNADWIDGDHPMTFHFIAKQQIAPNEEITITYGTQQYIQQYLQLRPNQNWI